MRDIQPARLTSAESIESWIVSRLAECLDVDPSRIDPTGDLPSLSLDSMKAVELSNELAGILDRPVPPTILWDHENIRALAGHLAGRAAPDVDLAA